MMTIIPTLLRVLLHRFHALTTDGTLGNESQQMIFVPQEEFQNVNKTRASNASFLNVVLENKLIPDSSTELTLLTSMSTTKASSPICMSKNDLMKSSNKS